MNKRRFSVYFYNPITYIGVVLALLVFLIEVFLFGIDFFSKGSLYLGIFTYCLLPPFLFIGLFLIPLGALWKRRRVAQGKASIEPTPLRLDPSIPTHRNAAFVFLTGTFILVIMSIVGAYKGFHYTESVEFCGLLCHKIMKPEHTAYLNSPHARVKCVECHIGSGADWYVRSKLSGARQVFRTIADNYEKPIATPVHNLRPAPETCEQCHWPGKFFGSFDFKRSYFPTDESVPRWDMRMLLSVGGGQDKHYGVHSHMNVDHTIYYAAEDEKRLNITWVKSVAKDGTETVYVTPKSKFKDRAPEPSEMRKMDCMDCHNRPSHRYLPPYRLVNEALRDGRIDRGLPGIKRQAMDLLAGEYPTEEEGLKAIDEGINVFYREKHPEVYASQKTSIDQASGELKRLFKNNMFPEMKARWDVFPDHIGHLVTPGCFRCHDGTHKSVEGKLITRDCNACHTIVEQGMPGATEKNIDGMEFKHPVDIGEAWKDMDCTDCHSGTGA